MTDVDVCGRKLELGDSEAPLPVVLSNLWLFIHTTSAERQPSAAEWQRDAKQLVSQDGRHQRLLDSQQPLDGRRRPAAGNSICRVVTALRSRPRQKEKKEMEEKLDAGVVPPPPPPPTGT